MGSVCVVIVCVSVLTCSVRYLAMMTERKVTAARPRFVFKRKVSVVLFCVVIAPTPRMQLWLSADTDDVVDRQMSFHYATTALREGDLPVRIAIAVVIECVCVQCDEEHAVLLSTLLLMMRKSSASIDMRDYIPKSVYHKHTAVEWAGGRVCACARACRSLCACV
jgi:hypothetical protein